VNNAAEITAQIIFIILLVCIIALPLMLILFIIKKIRKHYNPKKEILFYMFPIKGINYRKNIKAGDHDNVSLMAITDNEYDKFAIKIIVDGEFYGWLPAGNEYLHKILIEKYDGFIKGTFAEVTKGSGADGNTYYRGEVALSCIFSKELDPTKLIGARYL